VTGPARRPGGGSAPQLQDTERLPQLREIVVVEGRDDTAAVRRAVEAETIETHGYGISAETWARLERAAAGRGLIILTDPDHAGEQIRRRLRERFPEARHAFLPRDAARAPDDDIGVENAAPAAIRAALLAARREQPEREAAAPPPFTAADLRRAGLSGRPGAAAARQRIGRLLGIGYGNAVTFLRRLNAFGISRAEFDEALREAEK
jgi:ribonuclease M5